MNLPKIGELVTITNPENGEKSIGKVVSIDGFKVKISFKNNSWIVIELNAPN